MNEGTTNRSWPRAPLSGTHTAARWISCARLLLFSALLLLWAFLPAPSFAEAHELAVAFIAEREKFVGVAYHDTAGYPTIGYGEKLSDVQDGDLSQYPTQTEQEARQWLGERVSHVLYGIRAHLTVKLDSYQEAALTSLAYNIGLRALEDSKLLLLVNGGSPLGVIVGEWVTWDKERRGGRLVRSRGLSNRRALETALYLTGIYAAEQRFYLESMKEVSIPKRPVTVVIDSDVPEEVSELVLPIVTFHADLIPSWCDKIAIEWGVGQDGSISTIDINENYRWAVITLTGQWLGQDQRKREESIIHELCHLIVVPLSYAARELVGGDKGLKDNLLVDATERVVCDLTRIIESSWR